ncbi:MAG: hypothetical protein H6664_11230, partial [Ardenticatenaceae bacterium]|nr:hypothetical protein [Ardenticatenaceae bacterium]
DGAGVGGPCTGSATFASPAWFLIGSGGSAPTAVTLQSISATNQVGWVSLLVGLLALAMAALRRQQR